MCFFQFNSQIEFCNILFRRPWLYLKAGKIDILSTIFWSMQEHHLNILSTEFWSMGHKYSMYMFFFQSQDWTRTIFYLLQDDYIYMYIYLVTPKYAKKKKAQREKPGFTKLCLFYPECSLFSNSVIWGVWLNCHHPSMEAFAAQRFLCTRNSRIVPEIRGIVLEIPGEQFSHIRDFFNIPYVLLLRFCTVFPEMSSFCNLCYLFLSDKTLVSRILRHGVSRYIHKFWINLWTYKCTAKKTHTHTHTSYKCQSFKLVRVASVQLAYSSLLFHPNSPKTQFGQHPGQLGYGDISTPISVPGLKDLLDKTNAASQQWSYMIPMIPVASIKFTVCLVDRYDK